MMGETALGTQRILVEQKKSFLYVQNHSHICCQTSKIKFLVSQNIVFQWYMRF